jgi:hypothetical protein
MNEEEMALPEIWLQTDHGINDVRSREKNE